MQDYSDNLYVNNSSHKVILRLALPQASASYDSINGRSPPSHPDVSLCRGRDGREEWDDGKVGKRIDG